MDAHTLRWKHELAASAARRERSATFWKVTVGVISSAALTTALVSTALGRGESGGDEPGITQTSAAEVSRMPTPRLESVTEIQTPVASSVGMAASVAESTAAPPPSSVVAEVFVPAPAPEVVVAPPVAAAPAVTPAPGPSVSTEPEPVAAAMSAPAPEPASTAPAPASAPADPRDSIGAGRFSTDAPPWSASSFTSDPNAGAGPFTTEWNIPAFGSSW